MKTLHFQVPVYPTESQRKLSDLPLVITPSFTRKSTHLHTPQQRYQRKQHQIQHYLVYPPTHYQYFQDSKHHAIFLPVYGLQAIYLPLVLEGERGLEDELRL